MSQSFPLFWDAGERATLEGTVRRSTDPESDVRSAASGGSGARLGPVGPAAGEMSGAEFWSERADAYRTSAIHSGGEDLDLVIEWCEPGPGVTALDVATGGGHVATRLREAGCTVVTVDPAPGMRADAIAPAENMPFAESSFDAVACRLAAHHFPDVLAAVKEMVRVTRDRVVICDNVFVSEVSEEADRLRDPTHVRHYGAPEWESFFELAGLAVAERRVLMRPLEIQPWLDRAGCRGEEAEQVRALLGDRIVDGWMDLPTLVIKGKKQETGVGG
jgi:SAM-dependent methyltransferase